MEDTTRGPGSAQQTSGNKSAFDLFLMRGLSMSNKQNYGILFETPSPDPVPTPDPKPDALEERLSKMEAKLNAAHATIRKLTEPKPKPDPDVDPKPDPEPKKSASEKALEARLKAMEEKDVARQAEVRQEKVNASLETAANKLKIDPDRMDDFFAYVDRKYGKKIVIDADTKQIVFRDSDDDEPVGLMEWLGTKNTAKEFDRYKPAPVAPTKGSKNNAGPGSHGAEFEISIEEFTAKQNSGQIPMTDLMKYKIV